MSIISFDLHGILNKYPEILKPLLEMLSKDNVVLVVSGPPEDDILKELSKLGYQHSVHYDNIISVTDYIKEKGIWMWKDKYGNLWCDDESWWSSKSEICEDYGIDILFDDSKKYGEYFTDIDTKFVLVKG
jgi:hypothetical protein